MIGRGQVETQHPEDRRQEAFSLPQGQVEDEPERQRGFDGEIGIRRWCADAGRPTRFTPSSPSPTDAVRDGSAKLGHPVQNITREHGLTPLPR